MVPLRSPQQWLPCSHLPSSCASCLTCWFKPPQPLQALEPSALIALQLLAPGGRLVLVGDPQQLPATVVSRAAAAAALAQSLFERLMQVRLDSVLLICGWACRLGRQARQLLSTCVDELQLWLQMCRTGPSAVHAAAHCACCARFACPAPPPPAVNGVLCSRHARAGWLPAVHAAPAVPHAPRNLGLAILVLLPRQAVGASHSSWVHEALTFLLGRCC